MREFSAEKLDVHVAESREEMGFIAGAAAAAAIREALRERSSARLVLASAPSQNELLAALTGKPLDWARVTIFHMDEYAGLEAGHRASFRRYQHEHVLSQVTPSNFHGIAGEAADLEAECTRYAELLAGAPIDVVCLGIGENGHLAFNDPPVADFDDPLPVKVVELDRICRQQQVSDGCFLSLDEVPTHAITLTIPTLLAARTLFCVVPGARKAQAVRDTLRAPVSTACPATILRTHPRAHLYLDEESAALLD